MGQLSVVWHCGRLLLYVYLLSFYADAKCTWEDQTGKAGKQVEGQKIIVPTLDACKANCESNPNCLAVDFFAPQCLQYSTLTETVDLALRTYSIKTCEPVESDSCTMKENPGRAMATDADISFNAATESDCRLLCLAIAECQAYSYGSNMCYVHVSRDVSTSRAPGYIYVRKQHCWDDRVNCCFDEKATNTNGTSSKAVVLASTADRCKAACLAISSCLAATFDGSKCKLYTSTLHTQSEAGTSYYEKDCPAGAVKGYVTIQETFCGASAYVRFSTLLIACALLVTLT